MYVSLIISKRKKKGKKTIQEKELSDCFHVWLTHILKYIYLHLENVEHSLGVSFLGVCPAPPPPKPPNVAPTAPPHPQPYLHVLILRNDTTPSHALMTFNGPLCVFMLSPILAKGSCELGCDVKWRHVTGLGQSEAVIQQSVVYAGFGLLQVRVLEL